MSRVPRYRRRRKSLVRKKRKSIKRDASGRFLSYSGRGMYTSNALIKGSGMSAPKVRAIGDETGAISLTHREYIGDIYGPSNNFSNQSFPLNPGFISPLAVLNLRECLTAPAVAFFFIIGLNVFGLPLEKTNIYSNV